VQNLERVLKLCEWIDFRNVQEFLKVLSNYEYRVIGGIAVAFYVKQRIPSKGDLDVLVDKEEFDDIYDELVEAGWVLRFSGYRDMFDYVKCEKGMDVFDMLVDEEGIVWKSEYKKGHIRGIPVKVMAPEWIVALKLIAGREKDLKDVALLVTLGVCDDRKLRKVVREVVGEEGVEELENLEYLKKGLERR